MQTPDTADLAQDGTGQAGPSGGVDTGRIVQGGALASAIIASACCWLPLLLIAFGISGGALAATFEAWRPIFLPVTFVLLGLAFYFTYRRPKVSAPAPGGAAVEGASCCAVPAPEAAGEDCCPSASAKGFTLRKVNKVMLWVVTVFVLAFAFFPNYVGYLIGNGGRLAARNDLDKFTVAIEGMTCEACSATIERALEAVPGVAAAEVSYDQRRAIIGVKKGAQPPREAILSAIAGAGDYLGRFMDEVQWTLTIAGMTCEGCAAAIQAALSKVPGVTGVSVSYAEGRAWVAAGASVTAEALRKVVTKTGYAVTAVEKR